MEERGRKKYHKANPGVEKGDEKYPDIFLPEEYWDQLAELGAKHMKQGVTLERSLSYERLLRDLVAQPFIIRTAAQIRVLGDDVRRYLGISEENWKATESLKVTAILDKLGWEKKQVWIKGKDGGKDEVKQGYRFRKV